MSDEFLRVDVLHEPSYQSAAHVDTYFCETQQIEGGAMVLSRARLDNVRPGDLHNRIILPLHRIAFATVNTIDGRTVAL